LGNVKTPTASITFKYRESIDEGITLKQVSGLNELVVASLAIICKPGAPEEQLHTVCEMLNQVTGSITGEPEIPVSAITAKVTRKDDNLIFRISGSLDAEMGMMAQGVLQGIGLSELRLTLEDDSSLGASKSSSKLRLAAEISTACVEMLGEISGGKLPPLILYALSWFKTGAVNFRFSSLDEALKSPIVQELAKGVGEEMETLLKSAQQMTEPGTLVRQAVELFYKRFLKEEELLNMVAPYYTTAQSCFDRLDRLEIAVGDHIFEVVFDVPYLFKSLPDLQVLIASNAGNPNSERAETLAGSEFFI